LSSVQFLGVTGTPLVSLDPDAATCPIAIPNWKLSGLVKAVSAVNVEKESCVGEGGTQHLDATDA